MNTLRKYFSLLLILVGVLLLYPITSVAECTAEAWDQTVNYVRGDIVTHNNNEWRAKRTTQGVTPGTHKPTWADLGICETNPGDPPPEATQIQIFGVWHAGNHYADWTLPREMGEFDQANHWIIDRGDGTPSVNLVVLSFLQPMDVLYLTTDATTVDGVPIGMTQYVVNYFKNAGIRVMMSIGGVTYTDFWDEALLANFNVSLLCCFSIGVFGFS